MQKLEIETLNPGALIVWKDKDTGIQCNIEGSRGFKCFRFMWESKKYSTVETENTLLSKSFVLVANADP